MSDLTSKILVVEDSKTINNIVTKELRAHSFHIDQAYNFFQAKEFLKNENYTLIILDLHLPDGEGSELIANIQSLTKTKVIILTSSQDEDLREELFQYGVIDYIIKDSNLFYSIHEIIKVIYTIQNNQKKQILIIDDSKFITKQVKTILEPRNYTVTAAHSAIDGITKLNLNDYHLLILDMELPDMHGLEVLKKIRKEKSFLSLPIIVLSGSSTAETVREILKNGASDFVKKPFVSEEFILRVDLWIDYHFTQTELEKKTQELQEINKNLETIVAQKVEENRKKDKIMFSQSRHAQMGEMISMIAHQWRQPLNSISAAIALMNLRIRQNKIDPKTLQLVATKVDRYVEYLSGTIDDFRNFFKPQKQRCHTNLKIVVDKSLSLILESLEEKGIDVDFTFKEVEPLYIYENELIQVILNILKNAEDALLSKQKNKQKKIIISIQKTTLTISDNAGGIPNALLEKIFDPYFSTKENKNGTGLGLYMSKIIIEEHCHGSLHVSNSKEGAVFCIELPKQDQNR